MKYRFIKIKNKELNIIYDNWFLYCDSIDSLLEHEKIYMKSVIEKGIKDFFNRGTHHFSTQWSRMMGILGESEGLSGIEASCRLESDMFKGKAKTIINEGNILLREGGTYMTLSNGIVITEELFSDNMMYPEYSISDIKITSWKGGKHFYAKIGNMDVVVDGEQKWNTYDEAYQNAVNQLMVQSQLDS